jgi:DNA-binding transcriptional MerR regulator
MLAACGVTEAAKRAGLTTHQVRNYVQSQLLGNCAQSARGHYQFDQAAIRRLRLIGLATSSGWRIEELRRFLVALDEMDTTALKTEREAAANFVHERRTTMRKLVRELNHASVSPDDYGSLASRQV